MALLPYCRIAALTLVAALAPSLAIAQPLFSEATETDEELIALYDAADSDCRLSPSRDVRIAVACHSRSIYGAALNERGWCYGRESEANADMQWHQCAPDSLRFPELDFTIW